MSARRETLEVDPPIGPGFDQEVCFRCGDEIDCDDEAVTAPVGMTGGLKMVSSMHTWCAVQDGFRLRWPA